MTQDLYYYESGYLTPNSGYFVYTADAESIQTSAFTASISANRIRSTAVAFSSAASISAIISRIRSLQANLSSSATISCTISHIEGADLTAFTNAALAATPKRIRDNNIQVTSAYTITANAERVRYYSSAASSNATVNAVNLRVRYDQAAMSAAFSLAVPGERIRPFAANQSAAFTQASTETYLRRTTADLSASATFYCDATRIPGGVVVSASGTWTSSFTLTGSIVNIHGTDLTAFTNATLSAAANRTRNLASTLSSQASVNATILRIQSTNSSQTASATLSAIAKATRTTSVAASAAAAISCTISHIEGADLSAFSNTTLTATFVRTRRLASSQTSTATVSVVNKRIRNLVASISSSATVSASADKLKGTSAALSSAFIVNFGYLSFKNKRPYTLYYQTVNGGTTYLPIDTSWFSTFGSTTNKYGGGSLLINSNGRYVKTNSGNSSEFAIAANEDFIISAWVYVGSGTGVTQTLFGAISGQASLGWKLELVNIVGNMRARFQYNATSLTSTNYLNGTPLNGFINYKVSRTGPTLKLTVNGVDTNVTFTGSIEGGDLLFGNTTYPVYFDDVFFARGISSIQNYTGATGASAIADGKLDTTAFLFHFDGDFVDDISGIARAQAALTSSASLSATIASGIRPFTANLSSAFTQTATAKKSVEINLTAFSNAALTATALRIKSTSAALSTAFSQTTNAGLRKQTTVALSSAATLTASALDLDLAQANLSSAFTASIVARKSAKAAAALQPTLTMVANATEIPSYQWPGTYRALLHFNGNTNDEISNASKTVNGSTYTTASTGFGQALVGTQPYVHLYRSTGSASTSFINEDYWSVDFKLKMTTAFVAGDQFQIPFFEIYHQYYDALNVFVTVRSYVGLYKTSNQSLFFGTGEEGRVGQSGGIFPLVSISNDYFLTERHIEIRKDPSYPTSPEYNPYKLFVDGVEKIAFGGTGGYPDYWGIYLDRGNPSQLYIGPRSLNGSNTKNFVLDEVRVQIGGYFNATTAAPYAPIQNFTTFINSNFTVNANGTKVVRFAAGLSSAFAQTANNGRLRSPGAKNLTSTFTETVTGIKVGIGQAGLTSTATLSATPKITRKTASAMTAFATEAIAVTNVNKPFISALSSSAQVSATIKRTRTTPANVNSAFTLTARPYDFTKATAAITSTAAVSATILRIQKSSVVMSALASELAAAAKIGRTLVHFNSTATVSAVTRKSAVGSSSLQATTTVVAPPYNFTKATASLTSTATVSVVKKRIRGLAASATSTATLTVNVTKLRPVTANLSSAFTESVTGKKTTRYTAALTSAATVSAVNRRVRYSAAALTSRAALVANNQILRLASANLSSQFTEFVVGGVYVRFEVNLEAFNTQLTAGRVINIDPALQLIISKETRTLVIEQETRDLLIPAETRVNIIKD